MTYELLAFTSAVCAIILLWINGNYMIEERNIFRFFPFFIISLALLIYPIFMIFEFFFNWSWGILEFLIFIGLAWILIKFWRKRK